MSDNVVLVAPRPLRVSSLTATQRSVFSLPSAAQPPVEVFSRMKLADDNEMPEGHYSPPSGRNTTSPRLNNLSSDVLEEFFSILRPSLFTTPSSPTFRPRRHGSIPALAFPYELPFPDKQKQRSSGSIASLTNEDADTVAGSQLEARQGGDGGHQDGTFSRIPGILESPVSRIHTRNPFQRHPSYDVQPSSHLSPTLLPLPPSPSPAPLSLSPPPAGVSLSEAEETSI